MAAANISPRRRRTTILATALADLDGFALAVDCLAPDCAGERRYLIQDLAGVYGRQQTVADVLRRMRCTRCHQRPVAAAWLVVGPALTGRTAVVRIALAGPEERD